MLWHLSDELLKQYGGVGVLVAKSPVQVAVPLPRASNANTFQATCLHCLTAESYNCSLMLAGCGQGGVARGQGSLANGPPQRNIIPRELPGRLRLAVHRDHLLRGG